MADITTLEDAVAGLIEDGDTVAMEGFTHLIPHAAGHQVIRAGKRNLTAVRMTPDLIYDQLIGMNCVRKLIFSWGGNPGVGSLYRFRDAVEKSWPAALEIEEHSHADLANAYVAGASGLPFAVLRGYVGCDLPKVNPTIKSITCPFTGERLAAVSPVEFFLVSFWLLLQESPGGPISPIHLIFGNPWIMVGLFFVIFYVLLIRPQKKQQRETKEMQEQLKKNDNVRTSSGFFGKVVSVDKDQDLVVLKIDESHNVRMRVLRSSIVAVLPDKKH